MEASYEDAILRDLRVHLQTAKIPVESLSTLAQQGDDKLVQQFLTENIKIDGIGPDARQSQLYIASFWGIKEVVTKLFESRVDPNKQNKGSLWTPLHAATFQEHGPVVLVLLEYGAQPELPDSEGRTPKDFASASDKIWPLFAALGLERTSRPELINKGIIRKGFVSQAVRSPGYGIKMADYSTSRPDRNWDDNAMQAAMMGDVLASDNSDAISGRLASNSQPQFSLWK